MKKVIFATMVMVFSMSLFSCTQDSIAETDSLYDAQATEGDDGDVDPGREDG